MPYMPQYVKDQRKTLVEEIVKDMQDGKVFMWDKGFTSSQAVNAVTNKPYRGGNVIRLGYSAYKNGFKDRRWMTFKQAQDKGYKIKKGSKGTSIEYFDVKELVPEQVASKTKDGKKSSWSHVILHLLKLTLFLTVSRLKACRLMMNLIITKTSCVVTIWNYCCKNPKLKFILTR